MPTSYFAANSFVDFQSDHTGAAATYKPTAQIPIANAILRARPMLKHTLLIVLVCAKCPACSLLWVKEYRLRGTRLLSARSSCAPSSAGSLGGIGHSSAMLSFEQCVAFTWRRQQLPDRSCFEE